jgi:isopenicillin N synthase-like dioxygenase
MEPHGDFYPLRVCYLASFEKECLRMNVQKVDFSSPTAPQDFARSLQHTGFAVLTHHPIPWSEIEAVYAEWEAFFLSDACEQYPFDPALQDGYVSPKLSETAKGAKYKDLKSFYHLYFPQGRYPKEISPRTRELFHQMFELGKTLLNWLDDYMPADIRARLKCPLREMVDVSRTLFRILYYPAFQGNEEKGAIRAEAHSDINLITLLPAATQKGLQVQTMDGNWEDVPLDPKSFIINIGDMLQEASGKFYRSTPHRVINPEGSATQKARMTMPMFVHPKANAYLSEQYPAADLYLKERLMELGLYTPPKS